jgi:hypothetical protein
VDGSSTGTTKEWVPLEAPTIRKIYAVDFDNGLDIAGAKPRAS